MRVGIADGQVDVTAGRRYIVTMVDGKVGEVVLTGRYPNGDLRADRADDGRPLDVRVKARKIKSLVAVPDSLEDVESDAGQAALEAAAKLAKAARNGKAPKRPPTFGPDGRHFSDEYVAYMGGPIVEVRSTPVETVVDGTVIATSTRVDLKPSRETLAIGVGSPASKPKGTPYAKRNQVWKCGTCGRRTRKPFCDAGHAPVAAPAGKRKADRA